MNITFCWMPLRKWQSPWGFRRIWWRGADLSHAVKGWQLGLGIVGIEVWL